MVAQPPAAVQTGQGEDLPFNDIIEGGLKIDLSQGIMALRIIYMHIN